MLHNDSLFFIPDHMEVKDFISHLAFSSDFTIWAVIFILQVRNMELKYQMAHVAYVNLRKLREYD